MVVIRINGRVQWRMHLDRQSNYWIAECDELGISICAKGLPELQATIAESMELMLDEAGPWPKRYSSLWTRW